MFVKLKVVLACLCPGSRGKCKCGVAGSGLRGCDLLGEAIREHFRSFAGAELVVRDLAVVIFVSLRHEALDIGFSERLPQHSEGHFDLVSVQKPVLISVDHVEDLSHVLLLDNVSIQLNDEVPELCVADRVPVSDVADGCENRGLLDVKSA